MLIIPLSLAAPLLIMLWASFLPLYTGPSLDDFARMTLANYRAVWTRDDIVAGICEQPPRRDRQRCAVAAAAPGDGLDRGAPARERCAGRSTSSLRCRWCSPASCWASRCWSQFLNLRFIPIYGTVWILIFAFVVKFLPYGMRFCHSGLLSINRDLEDGAHMSGAGHFTVLRRIVLPLASPAVVATWIYVFMHAIRDLSVAILLSGPTTPSSRSSSSVCGTMARCRSSPRSASSSPPP